jgi:hypothetical protein
LAKSVAEATVLKNLTRSWKMIANQMALYEELQAEKKKQGRLSWRLFDF